VSNLLTAVKALLIVGLFAAGVVYVATVSTSVLQANLGGGGSGGDSGDSGTSRDAGADGGVLEGGWGAWGGLGRAVVPCLWAFDGWADVGALAEDLRDPQRSLPRIILASVSMVRGREERRGEEKKKKRQERKRKAPRLLNCHDPALKSLCPMH
jgi:amino acid transporter